MVFGKVVVFVLVLDMLFYQLLEWCRPRASIDRVPPTCSAASTPVVMSTSTDQPPQAKGNTTPKRSLRIRQQKVILDQT